MLNQRHSTKSISVPWMMITLLLMFFVSGFTALLYQVVWQRMLGLFSGSDVRSVTIVIAAYLLGLGLGNWLGSLWSDRFSSRKAVQLYGFCNLGIALFAVCSRYLFYDLLFERLKPLAQSTPLLLLIVLVSLLIPTTLMGISLPLVAKASGHRSERAASRIGLLYGVNTLGSGLGTLLSGWYIIGTLGYERTVYFGAFLSLLVGCAALLVAYAFDSGRLTPEAAAGSAKLDLKGWGILVFGSGFAAISLEIIWFRVLDTVLQSVAYTYGHLLAFILVGNALGSIAGAAAVRHIKRPKQVFLWIQGTVAAYSLLSIWLISLYIQQHPPNLNLELGYLEPGINPAIVFKYGILPLLMLLPPNFLLGFYFPLVQQAVQTDAQQIARRVGLLQLANILGNATGSLVTGLLLLNTIGTSGSLRLLAALGLGFVLLSLQAARKLATGLAAILLALLVFFPTNSRLWASLHGIQPQQYFLAAEDSTGVAAITESDQRATLLASGQAQAGFPYMPVHALLGSLPALMHPNPGQMLIIGLGSGGTAHTAGVNPLTQHIQVVELLGAEFSVLHRYASQPLGQPLQALFQDPRYEFKTGDGRRELERSQQQFDIIEADAIYPWRSRAGLLYSAEFFQQARAHLALGGLFVEWNAGDGIEQTFRSVFPHVMQLALSHDLHVLIGSEQITTFDRPALLAKLENPATVSFLQKARVDVEIIRRDILSAQVETYLQSRDGQPQPFNTDLFPRSEYYLNRPLELLDHRLKNP